MFKYVSLFPALNIFFLQSGVVLQLFNKKKIVISAFTLK